jgi:hypothetical protein
MLSRSFTVAQANALVPWLTAQFKETRQLAQDLRDLRAEVSEREQLQTLDDGGRRRVPAVSEEMLCRISNIENQIRERMEETASLGIEVRRVDGLVDFPSWLDGQLVYLCWRYGEEKIAFFHPTNAGFDSRKPLPESASEGARELN